ncbi:MAG TPA: thioredoxin peroxidase [Armatimonadetes bacterium]|nr:thioredoxin peroxidase [Armatimonadota bacterium]
MGKDHECCSHNSNQVSTQVGKPAPDFTCQALVGGEFKEISLSDYRGKWVLLYFYPLDFTFVCPTEIGAINDAVPQFEKLNCQVIAASTDSVYSHLAWTERQPELRNMAHPMLGDTAHTVSRAYRVLIEEEGIALRGSFFIDPDGVLQWININGKDTGRNVDELLRVLAALQSGGLTPCNWKPGDATL